MNVTYPSAIRSSRLRDCGVAQSSNTAVSSHHLLSAHGRDTSSGVRDRTKKSTPGEHTMRPRATHSNTKPLNSASGPNTRAQASAIGKAVPRRERKLPNRRVVYESDSTSGDEKNMATVQEQGPLGGPTKKVHGRDKSSFVHDRIEKRTLKRPRATNSNAKPLNSHSWSNIEASAVGKPIPIRRRKLANRRVIYESDSTSGDEKDRKTVRDQGLLPVPTRQCSRLRAPSVSERITKRRLPNRRVIYESDSTNDDSARKEAFRHVQLRGQSRCSPWSHAPLVSELKLRRKLPNKGLIQETSSSPSDDDFSKEVVAHGKTPKFHFEWALAFLDGINRARRNNSLVPFGDHPRLFRHAEFNTLSEFQNRFGTHGDNTNEHGKPPVRQIPCKFKVALLRSPPGTTSVEMTLRKWMRKDSFRQIALEKDGYCAGCAVFGTRDCVQVALYTTQQWPPG